VRMGFCWRIVARHPCGLFLWWFLARKGIIEKVIFI